MNVLLKAMYKNNFNNKEIQKTKIMFYWCIFQGKQLNHYGI